MGSVEVSGRIAWCMVPFAVVFAGLGPGSAGARSGDPATDRAEPPGAALVDTLFGAGWRIEALGRLASGRMCWLAGGRGELRVEILRSEDEDPPAGPAAGEFPAALLAQDGQGWTVVLGPDDQGTWNAWGREWAAADPSLGPLVRFGLQQLAPGAGGPAGPLASRVRRSVRPSAPSTPGEPSAFRREMVHRGLGQGGQGEILTLDRGPGRAILTSSRRPGMVEILLPVHAQLIRPPIPEVFTPLWPLDALLENFPSDPGTPGPEKR